MAAAQHDYFWERILTALAVRGAVLPGNATPLEIARFADSKLDRQGHPVVSFVEGYYLERRYGGISSQLSEAEAYALVLRIESLPLPSRPADVPPSSPNQSGRPSPVQEPKPVASEFVVEESEPWGSEYLSDSQQAARLAREAEETARRQEKDAELRRLEEDARRRETEQRKRIAEEEKKRRELDAEERKRQAEDAERKRLDDEEEKKRREREAEERKRQEEENARRKHLAEDAERKRLEEDARRKETEERKRTAEEEKKRREREAEERKRQEEENARRKRLAEDAWRKTIDERNRKAEEDKKKREKEEMQATIRAEAELKRADDANRAKAEDRRLNELSRRRQEAEKVLHREEANKQKGNKARRSDKGQDTTGVPTRMVGILLLLTTLCFYFVDFIVYQDAKNHKAMLDYNAEAVMLGPLLTIVALLMITFGERGARWLGSGNTLREWVRNARFVNWISMGIVLAVSVAFSFWFMKWFEAVINSFGYDI
jgi:hypothetical protein